MATPNVSREDAKAAVDAVNQAVADGFKLGSLPSAMMEAARRLGMDRKTFSNRVKRAEILYGLRPIEPAPFEIEKPPSAGLSTDELVEQRKLRYQRKQEHEDARALIPVKINMDGPIGIVHFGDPHVDDDGTDIFALEHDTGVVAKTPGLFAGNVGDTTNNWVGRLARLYGEQSTTAEEAWQLAEWFMGRCADKWLYVIGGNHDAWSGAGDPLNWITRQRPGLYQSSEIRLNLTFPNGREVRINAHHDFSGHSMWNAAHGSMKAAQMGFRDHLLINGHKHTSGYGIVKDPATGILSHCMQVASYKIYDRYAREKGFRDQHIAPCVTTIINPYAKKETGLISAFWDVDEAAEYLTHLRRKARVSSRS